MKTIIPKADPSRRQWYLIDAEGEVLGRIAARIASILRGKHKPEYTPHLDMGDHVIVINADKIRVTGGKEEKKRYTRYTGYPGGLRIQTLRHLFQTHPDRVLKTAVKGMLPKNRLGRKMIRKLRVYCGTDHPHSAQKPIALPEISRKK